MKHLQRAFSAFSIRKSKKNNNNYNNNYNNNNNSNYDNSKNVKKLQKEIIEDCKDYKEFFPLAREMKRKHTFFAGPTNSGKSYLGFNELVKGETGVYLSPLRLLALEGQEEIEKRGKVASLLTGEESDIRENATFISSTIEMANLNTIVDSVLIDEIQLLNHPERGWAWTAAVVGMPSPNIIMTGSEDILPTLKYLIEDYLNEELTVVPLQRIGKLQMNPKFTKRSNLLNVKDGTCLVCFSRRQVIKFKKQFESEGKNVSVLYGNLSPDVRRSESKRFRNGETSVLISTDCIGMGLNLPIQNIIFTETKKFNGEEKIDLTTQEVKQIAGRAGRFGKFPVGFVSGTTSESHSFIARQLKSQPNQNEQSISLMIRPTPDQIEYFSNLIGDSTLVNVINLFTNLPVAGKKKLKNCFTCGDMSDTIHIAAAIDSRPLLKDLHIRDRYLFATAPCAYRKDQNQMLNRYIRWLELYAQEKPVELDEDFYLQILKKSPKLALKNDSLLLQAENSVKLFQLYYWLHNRPGFDEFFPSKDIAISLKAKFNDFIENVLQIGSDNNKSNNNNNNKSNNNNNNKSNNKSNNKFNKQEKVDDNDDEEVEDFEIEKKGKRKKHNSKPKMKVIIFPTLAFRANGWSKSLTTYHN